jgi:hypothetical protein
VSDRTPQPGDRVRITYEAEYRSDWEAVGKDGTVTYPADAVVEVVEPADDPSQSPIGEVRREDHDKPGDPPGFSLWQKVVMPTIGAHPGTERQRWLCVLSSAPGNRGEYLDDDDVVGTPVIGAVPGTPAAEAQLHNMGYCGTCKVVHYKREPAVQPSPHGWEPRVFHAKGDDLPDEPPEDVASVVDVQGDHLDRMGAVWIGRGGDGYPLIAKAWENHVLAKYAPYREVQP